MKKQVTAIFDIGKTNKKFFLFDANFREVHREYAQFDETEDEDGHPTENLTILTQWVKDSFYSILKSKEYEVTALNFSAYGASFVHIDEKGQPVAPLYNYTKPMDEVLISSFFDKYGPEVDFSRVTGSPSAGMLNSGMQLYWIKHTKPELFQKIKYSLHLPQYLSYIFTGIPVSDYTSIGCHTALWDYTENDYHHWVYQEGIDSVLPPITTNEKYFKVELDGQNVKIGAGIHDSSAALVPYVRSLEKPFILVSTGTWSVALNPFSDEEMTDGDIKKECINYMRIDGGPVRSSRLFLGNEYQYQVQQLSAHFKVSDDYHKEIRFDHNLYKEITEDFKHLFRWKDLDNTNQPEQTSIIYDSYEQAYHQLMLELTMLQVKSIRTALGDEKVQNLFLDGGFSDNNVFVNLLAHDLEEMNLETADASLGSALGAAICVSGKKITIDFLNEHYALKRHVPFSKELKT